MPWEYLHADGLVLVCSLALTPDLRGCDQSNAVDVMRVPDEFGNPAACFMQGQAYLAQTEIGQLLDGAERVKVVCSPSAKVVPRAHPAEAG